MRNARTSDLNDRVLSNAGVAIAYLSSFAADPANQQSLFDSFTYLGKSCVNVAVKFGVLTNGNDQKLDKSKMQTELQSLLQDWLQLNSGFDAPNDEEIFRFKGAFDLIGHLSGAFGRREICI